MCLFGIVLFALPVGAGFASTGAMNSHLDHQAPMFPTALDEVRQGFVRIINHSPRAGVVHIEAYDDGGARFGPVTLDIDADETVHFNSADLEDGNSAKGLTAGTGSGVGDWWLALSSDLDIEVLSYIRTPGDGFLTSMHDVVPADGNGDYRVAIFNPGSNIDQASRLRLVNAGEQAAEVTITGVDDRGATPGGDVRVSIPAGAARTLAADELESGAGLQGALGDGTGKWDLLVASDTPVLVMSLLQLPTGHLTNLSTAPDNVDAGTHMVPLFPAASDLFGRQGFVRVINHSAEAGDVTVAAFDDTDRDFGSVTLSLDANETAHFNSDDLEVGNEAKGLSGSTGAGEGDWRLELSSALDIEVLAYIRTTSDGFLTAMHDTVPREGNRHRVAIFNPGSNANQVSRLRLVNRGNDPAEVTITGIDEGGVSSSGGRVAVSVPAGASRTLTAQELEAGGDGFEGELGDGAGKWHLVVESEQPIVVMSLLSSPTGHLTNLSTAPAANFAPAQAAAFDDRVVGNRIVGADPASYVDFLADGRFRETEGADTYEGGYTYNRTGTHLATVVFNYDDGDTCTNEIAFDSRTAGTLSYTCDDGDAGESPWRLVLLSGGGDGSETRYETGDEVTTLPTGTWTPDVTSNASFSFSDGNTVISFNNDGYIEEGSYRYTCQSASGCQVTNGVVESGTIVETSTTAMPADTQPGFASGSGPGNQSYTAGTAIDTLTLPAASGGDGMLTYSLSPSVPGLSFNGTARQLTGTPTAAGSYAMTYTATDEDGDTDTLSFTVTVDESDEGGNDKAALMALYDASDGANWSSSDNWGTNAPLDQWYGVSVDRNGRVTRLNLAGNQLSGPIPAELGGLANLISLNLNLNQLSGPIPAELGGLANLTSLLLGRNQLSGPIPAELGGLANLTSLFLGFNELSGPIPAELGGLANLTTLSLGGNELSGPIPAELGGLANLTTLLLNLNQLSGPIPAELGDLANLESLWLHENQLSGPIPAELGGLANLEWLRLDGNQLSGPIPAEFGGLANLTSLDLRLNELSGPIPAELGGLANLTSLDLGSNQLSGPIPAELGGLANLEWLWLDGNQLSGPIPAVLGGLANLEWLFLSSNQLSGPIPAVLGGLANLTSLDLELAESWAASPT